MALVERLTARQLALAAAEACPFAHNPGIGRARVGSVTVLIARNRASVELSQARLSPGYPRSFLRCRLPRHGTHHDSNPLPSLSGLRLPPGPLQFRSQEQSTCLGNPPESGDQ
jgi:hypothetical protein